MSLNFVIFRKAMPIICVLIGTSLNYFKYLKIVLAILCHARSMGGIQKNVRFHLTHVPHLNNFPFNFDQNRGFKFYHPSSLSQFLILKLHYKFVVNADLLQTCSIHKVPTKHDELKELPKPVPVCYIRSPDGHFLNFFFSSIRIHFGMIKFFGYFLDLDHVSQTHS